MSLVALGGAPCTRLLGQAPAWGRAWFDVELADEASLTGAQTLTLGEVISSLEDHGQLMDGLNPGEAAGAYTGRLGAVLRRATATFTAYLSRVTFAELGADGVGDPATSSAPAKNSGRL